MSLIRLHFGVSDTGTWSCQELSHQECEITICEITKRSGPSNHQECGPLIRLHFGGSDTGSWKSQELRLFIKGVPKFRNEKSEMRNVKTPFWCKPWSPSEVTSSKSCREELEETSSISEFGTWRIETLHHKNAEILKCRNAK
jgi:hypothetical protein